MDILHQCSVHETEKGKFDPDRCDINDEKGKRTKLYQRKHFQKQNKHGTLQKQMSHFNDEDVWARAFSDRKTKN